MTVYRVEGDEVMEVNDFHQMLVDLGMDAGTMADRAGITRDRIPMPEGEWPFKVCPSLVHGQGVFASRGILRGETVGPVRIGLCRTPLGFLTNHSGSPNAETQPTSDGGGIMVSSRDIAPGEEIFIDYREAVVMASKAENHGHLLASPGVVDSFSRLAGLLVGKADRMAIRKEIATLEQELALMPQADHGLEHLFTEGLYIRKAMIQAGTLFTTPVHTQESVLNLLQGRIVVITENGIDGLEPGQFILTKPGTKRVVFALDDVVATTVHPNPDNCRDIETLESRIHAGGFESIEMEVAI